jgi:hypothetical protein
VRFQLKHTKQTGCLQSISTKIVPQTIGLAYFGQAHMGLGLYVNGVYRMQFVVRLHLTPTSQDVAQCHTRQEWEQRVLAVLEQNRLLSGYLEPEVCLLADTAWEESQAGR